MSPPESKSNFPLLHHPSLTSSVPPADQVYKLLRVMRPFCSSSDFFPCFPFDCVEKVCVLAAGVSPQNERQCDGLNE